ncbi:nucleotidyltransferase domain-containing protein [Lacibacterium aquatile]|uniref:Nucleotidyltransferase domain-containing protein n=1 Tax=Lacibacterium aquatile TaxID=1168082 RepID=A0ABW5DL73_9PROT
MQNADAHPIDPAIREDIQARLTQIEHTHAVRILFACESGSRGWGFASPDSDYDVRFLYVHRLEWYLRIDPQRDVIEEPLTEVLDINGWDLRKALGLLKKGNATLIEWLSSPVVYRADPVFLADIQAAAEATHRPQNSFHHYFNMGRRTHREHLSAPRIRLKKYLYALRPLLAAAWIEQGRGIVPMAFQDLVDALVKDKELRRAIDDLIDRKRHVGEAEAAPAIPALQGFIEAEIERLAAITPPIKEAFDVGILDRLMVKTVGA